ncbi:uncharacterized protein VTP21DRAFT_4464 [Calcarisporiella thermophila]|uniref:uncharacterized protein n=1 Tax=Calcarisporiella thermophila TaxID=911321 RepID=UPI003743527E
MGNCGKLSCSFKQRLCPPRGASGRGDCYFYSSMPIIPIINLRPAGCKLKRKLATRSKPLISDRDAADFAAIPAIMRGVSMRLQSRHPQPPARTMIQTHTTAQHCDAAA